jgi:phosphatidylglycerol---prolipoprotein diacylglyceryl transferase
MLAYIDWHTSPEIFTIPSFHLFGFETPSLPLRWYGLMFAGAFLAGYQVLSYMFKKEGRPVEQADELLLYAMISCVIGARMGHYFFYETPLLMSNPGKFFIDMITPPYAGLASHGNAIGMFTAMYLFARKRKLNYWYVTDRIVPTVALGGAFIRFGNLMNSEIVGKPTNLPWAFRFFNDPSLGHDYQDVVPRHPAQLYESLSCIIIFIVLMWIWSKKKENTPHGLMTGFFMITVFTLRFLYEFLKENQVSFERGMNLNMGQWLSIPCIILGIIALVYALQNPVEPNSNIKTTDS